MIIDHMGLSTALRGKPLDPAVDDVIKMARLPNVAIKVSALPCYVNEAYPFPTLHPLTDLKAKISGCSPLDCL